MTGCLADTDAEDRDPQAEQPDPPLVEAVIPHGIDIVTPVIERARRAAGPLIRRWRAPPHGGGPLRSSHHSWRLLAHHGPLSPSHGFQPLPWPLPRPLPSPHQGGQKLSCGFSGAGTKGSADATAPPGPRAPKPSTPTIMAADTTFDSLCVLTPTLRPRRPNATLGRPYSFPIHSLDRRGRRRLLLAGYRPWTWCRYQTDVVGGSGFCGG